VRSTAGRLLPKGLALATLLAGAACRTAEPPAPLAISTPYEIDSLDPHARSRLANLALLANVYEPLVRRDADLALQPALAVRWFSESPTTWIFDLRPGVRFHDGRTLGAADVVKTFERLHARPELQLGANVRELESVRELGPMRVAIRTRRPLPVLLNLLSSVAILPGGEADPLRPVGSGPYRVADWRPGQALRLARHAGYWGARPAADAAVVRLGRAGAQAASDLLSGSSQIAILGSRGDETAVAAVGIRVERRSGLAVTVLGFDLAREAAPHVSGARGNPFRDSRVRQAISMSIDRERLVAAVPEPAIPANQPVAPAAFGFNPELPALPYDLKGARALLVEAGLPRGFDVKLHTRRIVGSGAGALRDMLGDIGVRVSVVEVSDEDFAAEAPSLYLSRFACETGDASDVLTFALHSADHSLLRAADPAGLALQAALRDGMESADPGVRSEALRGLMAMVARTLPVVPLYFDEAAYGVAPGWSWRPRADGYVLAAEASRAAEEP